MKATKNKAVLPLRLRQAIAKLGADISIARRKRSLTVGMMAERIGVHKNTYLKVEKGDPTVSFGIYAMALFVLGLSDALTAVADPGRDDTGLLLDADHLPKRVRPPKEPQALWSARSASFSMTPVVALARFALPAKAHAKVPLSNTTVSGLPLKFRKFKFV
jgi:DNA-binding XRE family transcriptional regulator